MSELEQAWAEIAKLRATTEEQDRIIRGLTSRIPADLRTVLAYEAGALDKDVENAALRAENAELRAALTDIANTSTSMAAADNDEAGHYRDVVMRVIVMARRAITREANDNEA